MIPNKLRILAIVALTQLFLGHPWLVAQDSKAVLGDGPLGAKSDTEKQKEIDALFSKAVAAYEKGEFETSISLAEKARAITLSGRNRHVAEATQLINQSRKILAEQRAEQQKKLRQPAQSESSDEQANETESVSTGGGSVEKAPPCKVLTVRQERVSSLKCPQSGQVLTGIESIKPPRIRCAALEVHCP